MKRWKERIAIVILALSVTAGAAGMYFEDCDLIEEAVDFHCAGGDIDACHEAARFHEVNCRGMLRR